VFDMAAFGKLLLWLALGLALVGIAAIAGERWGLGRLPLGRLPGDLRFERHGVRVWIPLASSILVSVVLSALAYLVRTWFRR
jgi:hypothetical protein